MALLQLRVFGPGSIVCNGAVVRLHSAKTFALLAYLIVESGRPHARTALASLLWENQSEDFARQSLRQAIYSIKHLGGGVLQHAMQSDQVSVQFDASSAVIEVDFLRFMHAVADKDIVRWDEAAALYVAPLLDGRMFADCDRFNDWLTTTREQVHATAMQNLDRSIGHWIARGNWDAALRNAEHWRSLDPASEAAARHLFRTYAARNEVVKIDAEWMRLTTLLNREFDARPSAETMAAYQTYRPSIAAASSGRADTIINSNAQVSGASRAVQGVDSEAFVRAARAAEQVYAYNQAVDLYERALDAIRVLATNNLERYVDVALMKESVLERLGRRADQVALLDEILRIAERLGDSVRVAGVLLRQAGVASYLGRYTDSRHAAERARTIYHDTGDLPGEAEALREAGFSFWHAQDYAQALRCVRDALELHRRAADVAGEASALHNLAEIYRGLGSPKQALIWYEEALRCHWAAKHHQGEILSLFGMANALQQTGDAERSIGKYREALDLSERYGDRTMQTRALHALAVLQGQLGDLDAALSLLRRAIEIDRMIGYAHGLGYDLVDLATLHDARGERLEAKTALEEAIVWFDMTGNRDALMHADRRIEGLRAGRLPARPFEGSRRGIKSHLPAGEGKVYCEFESPLAVEHSGQLRLFDRSEE